MKRALITGVTGQDGSYLAEQLLADGYEVLGLVRRKLAHSMAWAEPIRHRIELATGNLCDETWVDSQVACFRPHEVYHLAFPRRAPAHLNFRGAVERFAAEALPNLLSACARHAPTARVLNIVGHDSLATSATKEFDVAPATRAASNLAALRLQTHMIVERRRSHSAQYAVTAFVHPHFSPRSSPNSLPRRIARAAAAVGLGWRPRRKFSWPDEILQMGRAPKFVVKYRNLLAQPSPTDGIVQGEIVGRASDLAAACFDWVGRSALATIHWQPPSAPSRESFSQRELTYLTAMACELVQSEIETFRRALRRGLRLLSPEAVIGS